MIYVEIALSFDGEFVCQATDGYNNFLIAAGELGKNAGVMARASRIMVLAATTDLEGRAMKLFPTPNGQSKKRTAQKLLRDFITVRGTNIRDVLPQIRQRLESVAGATAEQLCAATAKGQTIAS